MIEQTLKRRIMRRLEPLVGWVMEKSIRLWANQFMDQFDSFKFKDSYNNTVYVSISYHSEWPDSFYDLDNPEQPYGLHKDLDTMGPTNV